MGHISNVSTNNTSGCVSVKVEEQPNMLPNLGVKKMSFQQMDGKALKKYF
jgi:hypothetical protein